MEFKLRNTLPELFIFHHELLGIDAHLFKVFLVEQRKRCLK